MRYRATLAYDGSAYNGYQVQAGTLPTIQGELERALQTVLGQQVTIWAAGRTDSGVHATGQVIAFDAEWQHEAHVLLRAINANLPDDIALQDIAPAPGFHPRFDAQSRRYCYQVLQTPLRRPLWQRRAWQIERPLNEAAMQSAAELLLGTHDFATFGSPPKGDNTVRTVFSTGWTLEVLPEGRLCRYRIEATAFLQHMVRHIVGMLVDVGLDLRTVEQFEAAFRSADRSQAARLAPPQGLFLVAVAYDGWASGQIENESFDQNRDGSE